MTNVAFQSVPKVRFVLRMIWPALAIFLASFLLIGWYEDLVESAPGTAVHGVRNLFDEAYEMATHIPGVCLSGGAVNDFQRSQCDQFWVRAVKQGAYTVAPLVPVFLFFLIGYEILGATYKRARKKLEKGAADFPATVTNPARMAGDFYSWMLCLESVSVQLNEKTQLRVYLPPEDAIPLPGQTMAVFLLGNQFGRRRFIGRAYTPHVSVK